MCGGLFTKVEVDRALFQMHPLKASGPDGLPSLFLQKYWHIIGNNVKEMV